MEVVYFIGSSQFDASLFQEDVEAQGGKQHFVGVDRGALRFVQMKMAMDFCLGDFDSVSQEDLTKIQATCEDVAVLPAEKDLTDTDAAFREALKRWPDADAYLFYGMLDGRLDHTLNNIWMAFYPEFYHQLNRMYFISPDNTFRFFTPGTYTLSRYKEMFYLSFIGLDAVKGLTLKNVKYPLDHYDMPYPQSFISNEFLEGPMTLSFDEGLLLCLQTKDA